MEESLPICSYAGGICASGPGRGRLLPSSSRHLLPVQFLLPACSLQAPEHSYRVSSHLTGTKRTRNRSGYRSDLLRVEFRSPSHKTYMMHAFGERTQKVRFSPTEAGTWTYHVLSDIGAYNDKEATFTVADSDTRRTWSASQTCGTGDTPIRSRIFGSLRRHRSFR